MADTYDCTCGALEEARRRGLARVRHTGACNLANQSALNSRRGKRGLAQKLALQQRRKEQR